uniref:RRM domain-containing protein n=1 Tax=Aegilops tauschii subsp. strangulata TaxID=200361 RepID=A0A453SI09_AEGTS
MMLNFVWTCVQVTFRDPDSARMACMDPYPVIDGRRANCNLAILGRPGPAVPFGPIGPIMPYNGGAAVPGGMYVPSPTYQQPPYNYSQALVYPPYGPSTYGPEYLYPQVENSSITLYIGSIIFAFANLLYF